MEDVFFIFLIAAILFLFLMIASTWIIFKKAGRPGWAAIVPIYNAVVQFQVAKMNPWLILLYLLAIIPIVGSIVCVVLGIVVTAKLGTAFNKGAGFILGMILLPFIFYPILAFGGSTYDFDDEDALEYQTA